MLPGPSSHHASTPMHAVLFAALLAGTAGCTRTIGTGTVRCHYMSYACGDCAPQFRVDSVLNGPLDELVDQDIQVVLDGSTAFVDTLDCLICWSFTAHGPVIRKGNSFVLEADTVITELRPACCEPDGAGPAGP